MEVVVPFGASKAGFLSGCPVELGVVAASKEGTEDAEFHAGVGADGGYTHSTRISYTRVCTKMWIYRMLRVKYDFIRCQLDKLPLLSSLPVR